MALFDRNYAFRMIPELKGKQYFDIFLGQCESIHQEFGTSCESGLMAFIRSKIPPNIWSNVGDCKNFAEVKKKNLFVSLVTTLRSAKWWLIKALNELKELVIQENETLSAFVNCLVEKFTEFAKLAASEQSIRYQEKRTIEQISYFLSRDHWIFFGYPTTLLEAKHILNNKKMGMLWPERRS